MMRELGFESCVCHGCVISIVYYLNNNMIEHDE